jgi:hypothetical protein
MDQIGYETSQFEINKKLILSICEVTGFQGCEYSVLPGNSTVCYHGWLPKLYTVLLPLSPGKILKPGDSSVILEITCDNTCYHASSSQRHSVVLALRITELSRY